jgi:hypothetical protein
VSGLISSLGDDEWATPSAAAGWTVKDVFTHFGDLLGILAFAADLERQATALLPVLESLQEEPNASTQAQLLDLGSYPLHAIPDMFSFDFYTHLRWDVLAPRGPLTGHDVPAPDRDRPGERRRRPHRVDHARVHRLVQHAAAVAGSRDRDRR